MAFRELNKNSRDSIRVSPNSYMGHDLIDIRIFAADRNDPSRHVATKKGVSINVDMVPDLIEALLWALGQPCVPGDPPAAPMLSAADEAKLASRAHAILRSHGAAVHWDSAERLILTQPDLQHFTKWNLHRVLTVRNDLFKNTGEGCFKAI